MDAEMLLLMSQALGAEHGIEVVVSDVEVFKRRFYSVRAKGVAADPDLNSVVLKTCPTDQHGKVWIVKKRGANGQD